MAERDQALEREAAARLAKQAAEQDTEAEIKRLKAELVALKQKNQSRPDDHDYNEAATRELFVDLLLREAGWPLAEPGRDTEFPVGDQPTPSGRGYVDYVLWGADGLPLAVVETKRTRVSQKNGLEQARLYAAALEAEFGLRPVIYCSNGYEHTFWDQVSPPRPVEGFRRREELEWYHQRQLNQHAPRSMPIQSRIVERTYQTEAIRKVCEHFEQGHRKALLVMATGTGKTRVSIALVKLLLDAGWVKRVLFLADRGPLVTQARRAFRQFLADQTTVDLTEDKTARGTVYVSTHHTMIRLVEALDGGDRRFGPGFFDLVIVDEAHRSVYKRFGFLFDWFDGLLVGLTATPRSEIHRDTYGLFELETGVPVFAYELADAVADGHLVKHQGRDVPSKFMRQGIRWADLSDDDKAAYEDAFYDPTTDTMPAVIDGNALNRWLFNTDTVDKIVQVLMNEGVKIQDGEVLGKTIVFARNHRHAEFIVERFDILYPHLKGRFARVIDSHDPRAQTLLDDFSNPAKLPQIAVSVDMLDTGVDVPEVVNLLFFKPVMSRVKFLQMVGRGTRKCKDLLGPGCDKQHFLVFDPCGNFDWFGDPLNKSADPVPKSLTERLFHARWDASTLVAGLAAKTPHTASDKAAHDTALLRAPPEEREPLVKGWRDDLHAQVRAMDLTSPIVRKERKRVEAMSERQPWDGQVDPHDIEALGALPTGYGDGEHPSARSFDLLVLRLQVGVLSPARAYERDQEAMIELMEGLVEKKSLPMVAAQMETIEKVRGQAFWDSVTLFRLEQVRKALRLLIQFVDKEHLGHTIITVTDTLEPTREVDVELSAPDDLRQYRRKVEGFIREHQSHVVIHKLRTAKPLTPTDLDALHELVMTTDAAESAERFERISEGLSLPLFIRRLVGLDRAAAKGVFAEVIEGTTLTSRQLRFIDLIVDQLTVHGTMETGRLYEPPFTEVSPLGLDDVFDAPQADKIIELVKRVNGTADARAMGG
ncbi:MAG: DEAD/DEAH box helicase family protein [Myxococcota bacterium]